MRTHILPLPIIGAMIIRIRCYYVYIILLHLISIITGSLTFSPDSSHRVIGLDPLHSLLFRYIPVYTQIEIYQASYTYMPDT